MRRGSRPARRLIALLPLLVVALPLLAGCWDFRGLEGRGFVVMAGVDRTPAGRFRVSLQFQIARPEQRGGGGGGGAEGPASHRVITGEGDTVRKAFERARADVAREIDPSVLETIVIGERAAANLADLDWIARSARIPVPSFVGVARGEAEEVVRAQTPAFGVPGEYTLRAFRGDWTRTPAVVRVHTWQMFDKHFLAPLVDPHAPAMTGRKYGLNWDGLAVFRGHALAGFLEEEAAALFTVVQGERLVWTIEARIPGRPAARAAMQLQGGKVRRWVTWEQDQPVLHVNLRAAGDLRELSGMRLTAPAEQAAVEQALARALASQITGLIHRLQALESDPLGFGERARRAAPYRREVQTGPAWRAAYRRARVNVTTQVTIVATGNTK